MSRKRMSPKRLRYCNIRETVSPPLQHLSHFTFHDTNEGCQNLLRKLLKEIVFGKLVFPVLYWIFFSLGITFCCIACLHLEFHYPLISKTRGSAKSNQASFDTCLYIIQFAFPARVVHSTQVIVLAKHCVAASLGSTPTFR